MKRLANPFPAELKTIDILHASIKRDGKRVSEYQEEQGAATMLVRVIPKEKRFLEEMGVHKMYFTLHRPIDERYDHHEWKIHEVLNDQFFLEQRK